MEILVFTLDAQHYGLVAHDVVQVFRLVAITRLPGAPLVIEGAIDVRGDIIPVLDLRRRFGLPERPPGLSDLLIIASAGPRRVAIRADAHAGVQQIDATALSRSDDPLSQSRFVAGLARLRDGMVVIQDLVRFLSEAESESLARALAEKQSQHVA